MARTNDINSATSQFFVNLVDNDFLDNKPGSYGYAVFGKVISGMDVIDTIAKTKTVAMAITMTCRGSSSRALGEEYRLTRPVAQSRRLESPAALVGPAAGGRAGVLHRQCGVAALD